MPVSLNYFQTPFNASVFVYIASGAATYAVQYTADPIDSANARWYDDPTLKTGTTTSGSSSYQFPVRGVRISIAANSGTVEFKVLQGL